MRAKLQLGSLFLIKTSKMKNRKKYSIRQNVYNTIRDTIGKAPAETGGYLFGNREDFIIEKIVLDNSNRTSVTWTMNPSFINPIIKDLWENEGLELIGFVHSHPPAFCRPSGPDVRVFGKYLERFDCDMLVTPIIQSTGDGVDFQFLPYAKLKDSKDPFSLLKLEMLPDVVVTNNDGRQVTDDKPEFKPDYSRIEQAVDMGLVSNAKVVIVGAGGAFNLYSELARTGVGEIVAIDFDHVESSNLVRQGHYISTIGKSKVETIKEHVVAEINPNIKFSAINKDFTKIPKTQMDEIMDDCDIILMMTDSFQAQAYGNKISQKYSVPAIWAGFYTQSRCAEIVFYIPGVTPGCFRCAVSSRYEAQSKKKIKISSNCNTIFHSALLDAYVGFITMAILHNDTIGYEFSGWFGDYFDRNLIQLRTHPSYNGIFKAKFDEQPLVNMMAVAWQKIEQEVAPKYDDCPDCKTAVKTVEAA